MGFASFQTSDTGISIPVENHIFAGEDKNEYKVIFPDNQEEIHFSNYRGNFIFGGREMWEMFASINGKDDGILAMDELADIAYDQDISIYAEKNRENYVFPKIVLKDCEKDYFDLPDSKLCEFQGYYYPETVKTKREMDNITTHNKMERNEEAREKLHSAVNQNIVTPELLDELRFDLSPKEMIEIAGEEAVKNVPFIEARKEGEAYKSFTISPIWRTDSTELVKVTVKAKNETEARDIALEKVSSPDFLENAEVSVVGVRGLLHGEPRTPHDKDVQSFASGEGKRIINPVSSKEKKDEEESTKKLKSYDVTIPLERSCYAVATVTIYAQSEEKAKEQIKKVAENIFMDFPERTEVMVSDYEEYKIPEAGNLKVKEQKKNNKKGKKIGM
jgi:hypothetical protein